MLVCIFRMCGGIKEGVDIRERPAKASMYICVYVHTYVCVSCLSVCLSVPHVCGDECTNVRMYVCMYLCMYVCMTIMLQTYFANMGEFPKCTDVTILLLPVLRQG